MSMNVNVKMNNYNTSYFAIGNTVQAVKKLTRPKKSNVLAKPKSSLEVEAAASLHRLRQRFASVKGDAEADEVKAQQETTELTVDEMVSRRNSEIPREAKSRLM